MAKLDSLIVDLQVNTAELRKGLDEANTKLNDFGKKMDSLAGVVKFEMVGKAALQAGQAIATLVLHGAESADKMGKMAQSAGVSVESLSQISYAARLADVSTEQLGVAMLKLNKNLSAAAAGNQEQVSLFKELGVSVTDSSGKMRTADAVMGDLADVFSKMEDGAAKASLATEVFGKSGAELIPLLNGGREGLAAAAAEADRFGLTVSSSAAKAAEGFNDNVTRMKSVLEAVGLRVAAQIAPAFEKLTTELLNTKEGASVLNGVVDALAVTIKALASAGVIVGAVFEVIGKYLGALGSQIVNLLNGDFDAARADTENFFSDLKGVVSGAGERLKGIWADVAESTGKSDEKRGDSAKKTAQVINAALAADKKAAEDHKTAFASLTKVAEDLESKVSSFGFGELGLIEARLNTGDLADQLKKLGTNAEEMRQRILDAAQALSDLKLDLKMGEIKFTVASANASVDRDVAQRRDSFAFASQQPNRGAYAASIETTRRDTRGFSDFDAALKQLAEQSKINAKMLGEAELLKYQNDIEGANAATLAAENARRAADKAGKAADAFTQLATDLQDARKKSIKDAAGAGSWGEAIQVLQSDFRQALGQMPDFGAELGVWFERMSGQLAASGSQMLGAVGELVNSIVQGAQAGGVWGAVIAAFMEIAKRTKSALEFLDTAMQFVEKIADMVEPLVAPIFDALQGVLEIVVDIVAPVFQALQPLFTAIGSLVDSLSPILWALGDVFSSLAPIIEFLGKVIAVIFDALKPVFEIIGVVLKFVATVVYGVLIMLNEIAAAFGDKKAAEEAKKLRANVEKMWSDDSKRSANTDLTPRQTTTANIDAGNVNVNGKVEMKDFDLSKWLGDRSPVDVIDIGGFGYAAGSVAGAEAAKAFVEAAMLINGATVEAAQAAGQEAYDDFLALGTAANSAANSLNKFSASLTNVPQGFKYNLAKFNATTGGDFAGMEGRERNGDVNIVVEGSLLSESELLEILERARRKVSFRQSGSPIGANYR